MIPAYARPAHQRLRQKLAEITAWNETSSLNQVVAGSKELGIITSGIAVHARAGSRARGQRAETGLHLSVAGENDRAICCERTECLVIEEGDPYLADAMRAAGIAVEAQAGNVPLRRIERGSRAQHPGPRHLRRNNPGPPGKPPEFATAVPHRVVFEALKNLDCIVAGDIGCYTLGVLPPFSAPWTVACAWAPVLAWDWACATCCRRTRRGGWSV